MAWMAPKLESNSESWSSFIAYAARQGASIGPASPASLLDSAAHVTATAEAASGAERDVITISLAIAPGYHVNANPASLDYLIPTTVKIPSATEAKIAYPKGKLFQPKFLPEGLSVYEGTVVIGVEWPKGRSSPCETLPIKRCRPAPMSSACRRQRSLCGWTLCQANRFLTPLCAGRPQENAR